MSDGVEDIGNVWIPLEDGCRLAARIWRPEDALSLDEALALRSEEAVEIALRTQQILAHETGVASTVDPLGGSYYIESLTDAIMLTIGL